MKGRSNDRETQSPRGFAGPAGLRSRRSDNWITTRAACRASIGPSIRRGDRPDLAGQVHTSLGNIVTGVEGAGGTVDDIARLTIYVVGWTQEMAGDLFDGLARAQASDGYASPLPPITVIGVQALWTPELLVEIEATAVLV